MNGLLMRPWKIKWMAEHPEIEVQTRRLDGLKEINEHPDNWEITGTDGIGFGFYNRFTEEQLSLAPRYHVGEVVKK